MTQHQQQLVRAILTVLSKREGGSMVEAVLHFECMNMVHPQPSLGDFNKALRYCETQNWVTGILGDMEVMKWAITDDGEIKRRQI